MITLYDTECPMCGCTGTTIVKMTNCVKCLCWLDITEREISSEGWYDY